MNESIDEIERIFLAFGDKTRLMLLNLMRNGEVSVNSLSETLKISQPKVSRHLAYLRSMDVVRNRRDGKWIYYSINEPRSRAGSQLFRDTLLWLASLPEMGGNGLDSGLRDATNVFTAKSHKSRPNTYAQPDMLAVGEDREEMEVYLL